jgi:hypothetical protein
MQVSLAFEQIMVSHFNVWGWRITLPWISTIVCWCLLCSWISRKPSTQHDTLIKLISSFLTDRKFKVLVEGKLSMPRKIAPGVPRGPVLAPVLYSLHINDAPTARGTHLALFADDTCIYMNRETQMSCSLQTLMGTHCGESVVWELEHKDQLRKKSGNLFLQKSYRLWRRTTTKWTRHSLCK